jgi:hypothetical protein
METAIQLGSSVSYCDYIVEHLIADIKPTTAADLGAGAGKYCRMIRRIAPSCRITAVEGYHPAAEHLIRSGLCDHVDAALIQDWLESGQPHDLAIFGDVIEHLSPREIHAVIEKTMKVFSHVIVVVPLHDIFQDDSYGNPLEIHKSYIHERFFDRYNPTEKHIVKGDGYTIMCLLFSPGVAVRSLAGSVFHCLMLSLQQIGLARIAVELLKRYLVRYKRLIGR